MNNQESEIYDDVIKYRYSIGLCPQKPNVDLMLVKRPLTDMISNEW